MLRRLRHARYAPLTPHPPSPNETSVSAVGIWFFAAMLDIYSVYVALFLTVYLVATSDDSGVFRHCDPGVFCGDVFAQSFALWSAYSLVILFSAEGEKEAVYDLLDLSVRLTEGGIAPRDSHHALRAAVIDSVSDTARRLLIACCVIATAPAAAYRYELTWVLFAAVLAIVCGATCFAADSAMFWPSRSLFGWGAPNLKGLYEAASFAQKAAFLAGVRGTLFRDDNFGVASALRLTHAPGITWGLYAVLACAVLLLSCSEGTLLRRGGDTVVDNSDAPPLSSNTSLLARDATDQGGGKSVITLGAVAGSGGNILQSVGIEEPK
jgi:hypothetical protein